MNVFYEVTSERT